MTTLPENVLTIIFLGRNANNAEDSLLRMTDTDQAYTLGYTDKEDFNIDLNM